MTPQAPELLPLADWLDEQIAQAASQQAQSYSMAGEYGQRQGERWHARQIALYETKLKLAALTACPSDAPVAWRYAHKGQGQWGWHMLKDGKDPTEYLKQWPTIEYDIQPLYALPPDEPARVTPTVGGEADPLAEAWREINQASERCGRSDGLVLACAMIERRRLRMGLQPIGSIPTIERVREGCGGVARHCERAEGWNEDRSTL